jgi:hypothetical protein
MLGKMNFSSCGGAVYEGRRKTGVVYSILDIKISSGKTPREIAWQKFGTSRDSGLPLSGAPVALLDTR